MDSQQVANIIADLPSPFKRPGSVYIAIQLALALPLAAYTTGSDNIASSLVIGNAKWRILDLLGTIWGIKRLGNEDDIAYKTRFLAIYSAQYGTANGIVQFLHDAFNLTATVSNANLGSYAGYNIAFDSPVISTAPTTIAGQLKWVRPAGVPFNMNTIATGLFLNTINYLGAASVTGAYLANSLIALPFSLAPNTNNAYNLLPQSFFTDPAVTGVL